MRSALLVTTQALYSQLSAEISGWLFDRIAEGWSARCYVTSATSGYQLRAELLGQPAFDHCFLVGDLPTIYIYSNPDGHFIRWIPAAALMVTRDSAIDSAREPGTDHCNVPAFVTPPFAAVGILRYENMQGLTDVVGAYRSYFARRHAYVTRGCRAYPIVSRLNDHFDYPGFSQIGDATVAEFAASPKALIRFSPVPINDQDGQITLRLAALINMVYSGGFDWQFLDYYGDWQAVRDNPWRAVFGAIFGSWMVNSEDPRSIQRWLLTGPDMLVSVYNSWGMFAWRVLLAGGTIGQAALASLAAIIYPYNLVYGDPTMQLDPDTLAGLPLLDRVVNLETGMAQLSSQVQALGAAGGGSPPPGIRKRNCGGPAVADWLADANGSGGQPYPTQGAVTVVGVANAAPAAVYSDGRVGFSFAYSETGLAPGTYTVRLHACENWWGSVGARLQDVLVQGLRALTKFDIFLIAGAMARACVKEITGVVVGADGVLSIALQSAGGSSDSNCWLCGYELIKTA